MLLVIDRIAAPIEQSTGWSVAFSMRSRATSRPLSFAFAQAAPQERCLGWNGALQIVMRSCMKIMASLSYK